MTTSGTFVLSLVSFGPRTEVVRISVPQFFHYSIYTVLVFTKLLFISSHFISMSRPQCPSPTVKCTQSDPSGQPSLCEVVRTYVLPDSESIDLLLKRYVTQVNHVSVVPLHTNHSSFTYLLLRELGHSLSHDLSAGSPSPSVGRSKSRYPS